MPAAADSLARSNQRSGVHRAEVVEVGAWSVAAIALVALRLLYLVHHRVDSDEPQHLHVVWGWAHGLVQYRDLFDNHAPLFHLAMAWPTRLLGEHPDLIVAERFLMLPFTAASLWAVARLGTRLWSPRIGAWAAVAGGLTPIGLLTSTEFRADQMWTASWVLALVSLLGAPLTKRRAGLGGLLLGVALATSLKTVLLLAALSTASVVLLRIRRPGADERREWWRLLAWMVAGLFVVPLAIVLLFWRLGALGALFACTVEHNSLPGLGFWRSAPHRQLIFPATLLVLSPWAAHVLRSRRGHDRCERRVVLVLATGFYVALLEGYWPLITPQDFLPWIPMAALVLVVAVHQAWARAGRRSAPAFGMTATLAALALAAVLSAIHIEPPWQDDTLDSSGLLADVLRFTRPGESIVDLKGETVFRPRASYAVLEGITKARIALGLLPDRIAADVCRSRAHFAVPDNADFPPAARSFLASHFTPLGRLRVLGTVLNVATNAPNDAGRFDVAYPERFVVLHDGTAARGLLDGVPYRGPRRLAAGTHEYRAAAEESHVLVVWTGAVERAAPRSVLLRSGT